MKQKPLSVRPTLLGHAVPYAFLAMYGDAAGRTLWLYVPLLVCPALLCVLAVKVRLLFLLPTGAVLSFLSSDLFLTHLRTELWSWYFKPFSPLGFLVLLSAAVLLGQAAQACLLKARSKRRSGDAL